MKSFITFIVAFLKIFIAVKVGYLLYLTSTKPESHPVSDLLWWMCFLIFDIWLFNNLPNSKDEES